MPRDPSPKPGGALNEIWPRKSFSNKIHYKAGLTQETISLMHEIDALDRSATVGRQLCILCVLCVIEAPLLSFTSCKSWNYSIHTLCIYMFCKKDRNK